MNISLARSILQHPEDDSVEWERNRTHTEKLFDEWGIRSLADGKTRFWEVATEIAVKDKDGGVWERWVGVYKKVLDGGEEPNENLCDKQNGEHYVWHALVVMINYYATKTRERAKCEDAKLAKVLLKTPKTPKNTRGSSQSAQPGRRITNIASVSLRNSRSSFS